MNDNQFIYAGIGSRETPEAICNKMTKIGFLLYQKGYFLYSGGADGADKAFALSVPETGKKIWRPSDVTDEAIELAKKFHPNWATLKPWGQNLIARNGFQILGPTLKTPVKFIVCWTKDGKASGGTGQALRIAQAYNIPVYNLFNSNFSTEEI